MELKWEDDYTIEVHIHDDKVILAANRDGLLSLANHLKAIAEQPVGYHLYLDEYNSLEDGSNELVIVKTE